MRLCVNWLPVNQLLTRNVARQAELAGLWGIGVGDSPNYGELYSACTDALSATEKLVVSTSVTNPVTRHPSVHISAARSFQADHPGRFRLGFGRGDSAVHTFGLQHATLRALRTTLETIRQSTPDVPLLVAASGPATARVAGRAADGVIAGVGADVDALRMISTEGKNARPAGKETTWQVWASMRLAVARDADHLRSLRRRMLPRSISAAHFAFASTMDGKNVPEEFAPVLEERFKAYDYGSHGRSGATSNAGLFTDRPDIERYLLDRFVVCGTAADCRERLVELHKSVDGIYLSLLFEEVLEQLPLIADLFDAKELTEPGT
jgi:alkanesulfonate monooxygenase SsuD/methylene tetrahydromethanopterin reductase-like flavin-dependent oxidoreductase (luciferase family)